MFIILRRIVTPTQCDRRLTLMRQSESIKIKGVPPQDSSFLKNGQINRVTNFSSTFGPTESDSEKKLGGYLDSRRGKWI